MMKRRVIFLKTADLTWTVVRFCYDPAFSAYPVAAKYPYEENPNSSFSEVWSKNVKEQLTQQGFNITLTLDTTFNGTGYEGANFIRLLFDNEADEAEFLMKASGGIEVVDI